MSVVAGATPGGSKSQWRGRRAGGPGRGCAGGRVGGGGSGRSRGGEQGWWDPVWRAEKLKQLQAEGPKEEVLDENEWWAKLEKLKVALDQQEVVIKRNFGRNGADILEDLHTGLVFTYFIICHYGEPG